MQVFIAYAGEARTVAESVGYKLRTGGHGAFVDRHDLRSDDAYAAVIKQRVADSDLFIFLITPGSVRAGGSYALTELGYAKQKWPVAMGHVLPVRLDASVTNQWLDPYLTAMVVPFEPCGDPAQDIADEALRMLHQNQQVRSHQEMGSVPFATLVNASRDTVRWHRLVTWTVVVGAVGVSLAYMTPLFFPLGPTPSGGGLAGGEPAVDGGTADASVPTTETASVEAASTSTSQREEHCREARVAVTVDSRKQDGRYWDVGTPPDVSIRLGNQWAARCQDTYHCTRDFVTTGRSVKLVIMDRDISEHDYIGSGTMLIPSSGRLGSARVVVSCVRSE